MVKRDEELEIDLIEKQLEEHTENDDFEEGLAAIKKRHDGAFRKLVDL